MGKKELPRFYTQNHQTSVHAHVIIVRTVADCFAAACTVTQDALCSKAAMLPGIATPTLTGHAPTHVVTSPKISIKAFCCYPSS